MSVFLRPHADSLAWLRLHGAAVQRTPALQATLALHRADLEDDLFPALLDAMAGSDAVCIRAMRERSLAQLDALARGSAEGEALGALCHAIVDFETRELLPMAERLLDDATLASLDAAMAARRTPVSGP